MSHPDELDRRPDDLARRKAELRALLLARRQHVEAPAAAAAVVATRLADLVPATAAVVAGYWPLAGELDPRPALHALAARGHRLALPRMQGPAQPLAFHAFDWGAPLGRGGFGVMQPEPERPLVTPDVVLVPLLGFDRQGHRLGYGKGYYDRTLRALRALGPAPLAIGVGFALQEVEAVPCAPSDEPLDLIVTERASHRCAPRPGGGPAPVMPA